MKDMEMFNRFNRNNVGGLRSFIDDIKKIISKKFPFILRNNRKKLLFVTLSGIVVEVDEKKAKKSSYINNKIIEEHNSFVASMARKNINKNSINILGHKKGKV